MQKSISIADGTGAELLEQLNGAFETLATNFTGGTEPQLTYAGMDWMDTSGTNTVWKRRSADNTSWITMGTYDEDGFHPSNTVSSDDSTVTKKGNVFNGANQLVLLNSEGKLPTLNGSLLTNLTIPTKAATTHYLEAGSDHSKILIKGSTSIEVSTSEGTKLFQNVSDTEYSFTQLLDIGTPLPGKDYSMFLVLEDSGDLGVKFSLNTTAPEGYSISDVLRIGGFHTMCLSITSSNAPSSTHPAVGYNSGEIIPNSIWDNLHRPKRLIWDHEYSVLADGSPEKVAVKGAAQPNPDTTGGHMATNNLYMISKYFLWEMAGLRWCWLNNVSANGGSGWSNSQGLSGAKGQLYGSSYALLAGGHWVDSSSCGSRSRDGANSRGTVSANVGGRGVCEPLNARVIVA